MRKIREFLIFDRHPKSVSECHIPTAYLDSGFRIGSLRLSYLSLLRIFGTGDFRSDHDRCFVMAGLGPSFLLYSASRLRPQQRPL